MQSSPFTSTHSPIQPPTLTHSHSCRSRRASTQSMLSPPQLGCELPSPHALAPSPLMPDSEFSFDIPTRMQGLELGSTPSSGPASMPRGLQRRLLGGVNAQLENDCFAP
eukprot:m.38499 g.38499  ORF g.38499 m.38499 type:complete len:109 (+) comp9998_c0_seq3:83-409(+)